MNATAAKTIGFSLFFASALSAAGAPDRAGQCAACHDQAHVQTAATLRGCPQCHAASPHKPRVFKTALPVEAVEKGRNDRPLDPGLGMSTAWYYPGSRLGAEPGPMVLVPAGSFIQGTDDRLPDEGPAHEVDLPAFRIDKYEVTNLQYALFIAETGRRAPEHFNGDRPPVGKADHPVTFVSWHDADAYCRWAGKRLPSEAEWEKAARGTDARTFAWGNDFDIAKANTPVRWERLGVEGDTTPVGAFEDGVSPYGAYDMSGNVWEWTASWYKPYPGNTKPSENYGEKYRTLKGGSWWDCSFYQCGISAPVYNRSFFTPSLKNASFGFRCAKDAS